MRAFFLKFSVFGLLAAMSLGVAQAQTANTVPVRILVGAPAGGTTDTMARTLAQALGQQLGRVVVVENKPGAGGNLAADMVAKAAPDGNTLLMSFTSHAINASLYPSLPFDPIKDFTPLTMVSTSPSILVAHPGLPEKNVADLVKLATEKPGQLNFAIGALGSSLHLAGDSFKMKAGVFIVNIPYRGTAPAVSDLLGGQVDAMFLPIHVALPQIKAGKLVALGIGSDQRHPLLPNVPTLSEAKAGKVNVDMWYGIFAPKNTPNDIVQAFNKEIKAILASEDVQKAFQPQGMDPANSTPEEFGKLVERDANRWAELIKIQNIKAE